MDRQLNFLNDLQDITDSLESAVKACADDDRIVMTKVQAQTLLQSFSELWDEVSEQETSAGNRRPMFLHVAKPSELYLQPSAIALVVLDPKGNAGLNMINGATVAIEALQWQIMKEHFHAGVEIVEVRSTGGLVKA